MARRDPSTEFWQAEKAERVRRESEQKHRRRILRAAERKPQPEPAREFDLDRIMGDLCATDEQTRAKAVRNLCPCRIGWERFQQGMEAAAKLRKDPSPEVRRQALHVFEDAYGMQAMESRKAEKDALDRPENDEVKRSRRQERQTKRETARAFGRRHPPGE